MKMTRRALAGLAALSALPTAGTSAQPPAPAAVPPPASPAVVAAASRQFHDAARQLASLKLAQTVEPASRFEA